MLLHVNNEDSDQTERMPRLIGVIAGRTFIFLFCHAAAQMIIHCTVKILRVRTPENLAVITLKFEQCGFTIE